VASSPAHQLRLCITESAKAAKDGFKVKQRNMNTEVAIALAVFAFMQACAFSANM
jgi:hypothetical protein